MLYFFIKVRLKRKRQLLKEEMESFGRDVKVFVSPLEGVISSTFFGKEFSVFNIRPSFMNFQKVYSPIDAEVSIVKQYRDRKAYLGGVFTARRKYLHIELQVWSDDDYRKEWNGSLVMHCYSWWGEIIPEINMGDLIKYGSPLTQKSMLRKVKLMIPKYIEGSANPLAKMEDQVLKGSPILER